jgi:hypothetical protein
MLHASGLNKLNNVLFCGGYAMHPLIQTLLTAEWARLGSQVSLFGQGKVSKDELPHLKTTLIYTIFR